MIIYVKQFEKAKFIYKLFAIFKKEQIDGKTLIYIPINNKSRPRTVKRILEKLSKYFYINNIKNIVLEEKLMQNEEAKNILYSYNINILDGTKLSKLMIYNTVQKIYQYKKSKIETGEITILTNENNEINLQNINILAKNAKRINIITNNTRKFKKTVDYLYEELGILIKLSSNMKININSTDIIINMDFTEEALNKINIPNKAIIINIPKNINIKSKKFLGVNIKNWEIEIPSQYKIEGFDDKIIYEATLYQKPVIKAFEQIEKDKIKIKNFIGINGEINKKEFS